jgi:hypothetical protein
MMKSPQPSQDHPLIAVFSQTRAQSFVHQPDSSIQCFHFLPRQPPFCQPKNTWGPETILPGPTIQPRNVD